MAQVYRCLEDACAAAGVNMPKRDVARGRWVCAQPYGSSKKDGGRIMMFADGEGGVVYNWVTGCKTMFFYRGLRSLSKQELQERRALAHREAERREREEQRRAKVAADKALKLCRAGQKDIPTDYTRNKFIGAGWNSYWVSYATMHSILGYEPHGVNGELLEDDCLVLPIFRFVNGEEQLSSAQIIDSYGRKAMLYGGIVKGGFIVPFNKTDAICQQHPNEIGIAEGWATAVSVMQLFDEPCLAALSCTNIINVVRTIRHRFPQKNITIYADRGNGQEAAEKAGREFNCPVQVPDFSRLKAYGKSTKGLTDWNDWAIVNGVLPVKGEDLEVYA